MSVNAPHRLLTGVLLALGLAACAGSPESDSVSPFVEPHPTTVRLVVQNRNFADARLYTYRRGERRALGVVTGKQDAEFTFEWPFPDPLLIEIDLVAGPRCRTAEMQVDPGDILELQIAPIFTTTSCR